MKYINWLFILICTFQLKAQKPFKSIVQEEKEFYTKLGLTTEFEFDSLQLVLGNRVTGTQSLKANSSATCTLNKKVFGWHPTWGGSTYTSYQWNLLSDLCYFDYSLDPATGTNTNAAFAWTTASVVTVAKNNGTKIHICATLFSGHAGFWSNPTAQTTFINNIVSLLNARGGNGVNIDFEGMGASDKIPFTTFITNLNNALNTANPNYQLSVCLYSVDWSGVFDMVNLSNQVDFFTIMGYDYYYSGSAQAGPTSPMYNFQTSYNYTLSKSITYYIKQGAPASKLVMGLPYYGREWEVSGTSVPANTTGAFNSSRTLSYINNNPSTYTSSVKFWEGNSFTPYFKFISGASNRQCFIDDVYSLGRKYDMVLQRGLAGIGIWALGYDNGMTSYWNLIQDKFSSCASVVCNDSLYDMGGPTRNYYDNENYSYVIEATAGNKVKLQFVSFGSEAGYDTLWLYNGNSQAAPLIGAYTGTNSPGTFTSTGQYVTLRFKSDGATNSFGYKIYKSCVTQTVATGIAENEELINTTLFPNPASSCFYIRTQLKDLKIEMTDVLGRKLRIDQPEIQDELIKINTSELTEGIYFVRLQTANNKTIVKKVMIN